MDHEQIDHQEAAAHDSLEMEQTVPDNFSSPAPIQDASMDNSNAFGYRSPSSFISNATAAGSGGGGSGTSASGGILAGTTSGGNTSPGHRQSLRDYDEQLNTLRRENFNLKLRIYFLESNGVPGVAGGVGGGAAQSAGAADAAKEALYKQNVDLKVETEQLRAELIEKQGLICEAATAIELMEQSKQCIETKYAAHLDELQQKIQFLELEVQSLDDNGVGRCDGGDADAAAASAAATAADSSQVLSEVLAQASLNSEAQQRIAELEACVQRLEGEAVSLRQHVDEADERCAEQEELVRVAEQKFTKLFVECEELRTKTPAIAPLKLRQQLADRDCEIMTLQEQLQAKTSAHETGCKALQLMTKRIKSLESDLKKQSTTMPGTDPEHMPTVAQLQADLDAVRREAADAHAWRLECSDVCSALTVRLRELAEFLDTLLRNKDVLGVLANDRRKAMRRAVDSSLNLSNSLHNMSVTAGCDGRVSMLLNDTAVLGQIQAQLAVAAANAAGTASGDHEQSMQLMEENKENAAPKSEAQHQQQLIDSLRTEVRILKAELERSFGCSRTAANESPVAIAAASSASTPNNSAKRNSKASTAAVNIKLERHSESDACWSEPDRQVSQARIGLDDTATTALRRPKAYRSSPNRGPDTAAADDDDDDSSLSSVQCGGVAVATATATAGSSPFKVQRMNDLLAELQLKIVQHENVVLKQQCEMVESDNRLKEERLLQLAARSELAAVRAQCAAHEARISELTDALAAKLSQFNALESEHAGQREQLAAQQHQIAVMQATADRHGADMDALRANHATEAAAAAAQRAQLGECLALVDFMRENERELQAQIVADEQSVRRLRQTLDDSAMQCSLAVLERTKATAERRSAEAQRAQALGERDAAAARIVELNKRVGQLEKLSAAMQNRLQSTTATTTSGNDRCYQLSRSASSGTNFRYAGRLLASSSSADERKQRMENSSPDLGIESDAGRTSGSDVGQQQQQRRANLSAPSAMTGGRDVDELRFVEDEEESQIVTDEAPNVSASRSQHQQPHDCASVDREVIALKAKLAHTHQAHRQILQQLRISNTRKEQVERDIRREICKTQSVLQTVRTNIESVQQQPPSPSSPPQQRKSPVAPSASH